MKDVVEFAPEPDPRWKAKCFGILFVLQLPIPLIFSLNNVISTDFLIAIGVISGIVFVGIIYLISYSMFQNNTLPLPLLVSFFAFVFISALTSLHVAISELIFYNNTMTIYEGINVEQVSSMAPEATNFVFNDGEYVPQYFGFWEETLNTVNGYETLYWGVVPLVHSANEFNGTVRCWAVNVGTNPSLFSSTFPREGVKPKAEMEGSFKRAVDLVLSKYKGLTDISENAAMILPVSPYGNKFKWLEMLWVSAWVAAAMWIAIVTILACFCCCQIKKINYCEKCVSMTLI